MQRKTAKTKLLAMKRRQHYINLLRENAPELVKQFGITSMLLYGSVARGEHHAGSDVDLFVDMPPVMYNAVAASNYLENLLGCKVDLTRNHKTLKPSLLEQIKQDGVQIYTTA